MMLLWITGLYWPSIVGGVPAKVIKYRFEPEMIEELRKIDYSKLTKEDIEKHIDDLYTELKDPSQLDWMPKKIKSHEAKVQTGGTRP